MTFCIFFFADLSLTEKEILAYSLASEESEAIAVDCQRVANTFKDLDQLTSIGVECFTRKRNKVVLAFLLAFTNKWR